AAAIAGALWMHFRRTASAEAGAERTGGDRRLVLLLLLLFAASQVFMFGVVVWRYPMVYDFMDHRLWYFPWPFQALLVFGLRVLLNHLEPRLDARGWRIVDGALLLLALANVAQWGRHREISLHSDWFPKVHDQSARLKASLRDGKTDPEIWG